MPSSNPKPKPNSGTKPGSASGPKPGLADTAYTTSTTADTADTADTANVAGGQRQSTAGKFRSSAVKIKDAVGLARRLGVTLEHGGSNNSMTDGGDGGVYTKGPKKGKRKEVDHSALCEQGRAYSDDRTAFAPFNRKKLAEVVVPIEMTRNCGPRHGWLNASSFIVGKKKHSAPKPVLDDAEIKDVIEFVDENGDGSVTIDELSLAVRRSRRMDNAVLKEGKRMLKRLLAYLKREAMTVDDWFDLMDGSTGLRGADVEDGRVTTRELHKGMLTLFENEPEDSDLIFTGADVDKLMRFMDPNSDGDLSLDEVQSAIRKLAKGDLELKVTGIFQKLEAHMKKKKQRLLEFFGTIDKDGGGDIDLEELREGLTHIIDTENAERGGDDHEEMTAGEAWHTCFGSMKDGVLRMFPLINKWVRGHIGDSGNRLTLDVEVLEWEIELRHATISFHSHRTFQSHKSFEISYNGKKLYCCTKTMIELAWWHRALQKPGLATLRDPTPICMFGGPVCHQNGRARQKNSAFTRAPAQSCEWFMKAPYATVTKLSCTTCFMENEENRRRELQMHMVRLDHPVAHGKLHSAKDHSWSTLAAPGVIPNRQRAEGLLANVAWDGSLCHDGDTTDVPTILGNGGDFSDRLKAKASWASKHSGGLAQGSRGSLPEGSLTGGGSTVLGSSMSMMSAHTAFSLSSGTSVNSATSLYNSTTSMYHISDGFSKLPTRRVT